MFPLLLLQLHRPCNTHVRYFFFCIWSLKPYNAHRNITHTHTHTHTQSFPLPCYYPVQTGPGAHPASCTIGIGSSPGVKSGQGVTLTPHPFLVPWSRKTRDTPLLPLWATPGLYRASVHVQGAPLLLPFCYYPAFKIRGLWEPPICTDIPYKGTDLPLKN